MTADTFLAGLREIASKIDLDRRHLASRLPDVLSFGGRQTPNRIRFIHVGDLRADIDFLAFHTDALDQPAWGVYSGKYSGGSLGHIKTFYGYPVVLSAHVPLFHEAWRFPPHPFVEYEPSDEEWARPIGYGRLEVDPDTVLGIVMHIGAVKPKIPDPVSPLQSWRARQFP